MAATNGFQDEATASKYHEDLATGHQKYYREATHRRDSMCDVWGGKKENSLAHQLNTEGPGFASRWTRCFFGSRALCFEFGVHSA
ncbi:hypothetical protein M8J77_007974 [Diaphorina citri]|nr:hypothetical protein M8J77_007974 [Diaphorina citri]